ncbi:MAG: Asd/ArgC dimerization domain-containing protein [Candidatus Acidiferrales bacterium]
MPPGPQDFSRVAIVGASSLRGKELKLVLEERNFPTSEIVLLDTSVMAGTLTEAGGEPTFIRPLEADSFDKVRFAFFAGNPADAEQNWLAAQRAGATVIDLTGVLPATGKATAWIPSLTPMLPPKPGAGANGAPHEIAYSSPASPVIIACTIAAGLGTLAPRTIAITLFPPVSERDQPGIDELETQTTNLLSFRPIEQTIFDTQVAFNLLSRYGEESKPSLESTRAAIARDVAQFLAGRPPVPAVQLVQTPVFYGYAFSGYAEFAAPCSNEQLAGSLKNLGVKIAAAGDPAPTNISVAGENEIQLAAIEADPNLAAGIWLWGVADNLRLATTNAVRIAEELLAKSVA